MQRIQIRYRNVLNSLRQEGWSDITIGLVFNLFLIGGFAYALIEASNFVGQASAFPIVSGFMGLAATGWTLFADVNSLGGSSKQESESASKHQQTDLAPDQSTPPRIVYAGAAKFLAWIIGYYLAIILLGHMLATVVFLVLYTSIVGKTRWRVSVVIALVQVYLIFGVLANTFEVIWPTGIFNLLADPLPLPGFSTYYF